MGLSDLLVLCISPILIIFILQNHFVYSSSSLSSSSYDNHLCPKDQKLALFEFNQTLDIVSFVDCGTSPSYPKTNHWNTSSDCCTWAGVTCDPLTGDVIGLDLGCSQLGGVLDSNSSLFHLPHLQRLNLSYNNFYGSHIPQEFGRFSNSLTHLNLSGCLFSGEIPSELSHLSKLVSLDLSYNSDLSFNDNSTQFQRPFLELLLQNLTHLRELSLVGVTVHSIQLRNLSSSSLTFLDLSSTGLHGQFPDKIFLFPNLKILKLSSNTNITGILQETNWSTRNHFNSTLRELDLSETMLAQVPDLLGSLKSLKSLGLRHCNLSGSIPNLVSNLTHLIDLDLSENQLQGRIPDSFTNLGQLRSLSLGGNNFDIGPFPFWVANLSRLVVLDLSKSSLTGPLPSNITGLQKLIHLMLTGNSLNGTIPSWVYGLPLLEWLDLSSNRLKGQLDEFQFKSNSLQIIALDHNELHGFIPQSFSKLLDLRRLTLSSNNLSGIIEIEMFSSLKNLSYLSLSGNKLSVRPSTTNITKMNDTFPHLNFLELSSLKIDKFPKFLSSMPKLEYLDLSNNEMHGQIPQWARSMGWESLNNLNLSHNFLTGGLEQFPWTIQYLFLGSNLLEGSLPSQICNASLLEILDLSNNDLGGVLPQCFGNFSNGISVIDLRMNHFHGTIPSTFVEGSGLSSLNLYGNQFEGTVPHSLANCQSLEVLDLGNNKMNDTLPWWLEALPVLHVLVLRSNRFHGPIINISETKLPFPRLRILDLSCNKFSGVLPAMYFKKFPAMMDVDETRIKLEYVGRWYYQDSVITVIKGTEVKLTRILTVFTTIDLSSNEFRGEIPNSIGNLISLRTLNLSHNGMIGHIPSQLGNLSVLESLDLSSNQLVGEVPQELANGLGFLEVLNLSQNHLSGRIPQGKQFNTFGDSSYLGNLGLCGKTLTKHCDQDNKTPQPTVSKVFEEEDDSDFMSGFTWEAVLIGYGCGTLLGFLIGYVMFLVGKPKWFIGIVERARQRKKKRPYIQGIRQFG